ncbi:HD domain-containing protein [Cellulosilyticum ruminicola]|uniref:HD domain-containing protein n=1 Tax=Cellulosilyticum ruminicola TaxID=425254 RepID=UPI0006D279C7|nr:CRISPR-associated endonuclease Cas3'' [Cellulosilyticum ruminicola]
MITQRMERVNLILKHKSFMAYVHAIKACENKRIYCKHNMSHFMDVARLTYLKILTAEISLDQSIIYAAALLHDIGKFQQYKESIPHEKASAQLAPAILKDCGYTNAEIKLIVQMIRYHRGFTLDVDDTNAPISAETKRIIALFQEADKQSRMCFACNAHSTCNWPNEKKNLEIIL